MREICGTAHASGVSRSTSRVIVVSVSVPIVQPARDEPWGQRHVFCTDPAGTLIDVVQPIPPSSEWLRANGLAEPVG